MKYVDNERGSGLVYMLWIMVSSIVICVIVLNIAKVYAVKQQAANATQLAALAGTSVLVNAGKDAIEAFDQLSEAEDVILQLEVDDGKSVGELVDEKAQEYRNQGLARDIAYINSMNDILTPRMAAYGLLKSLVYDQIKVSNGKFNQTVRDVVKKNGGNEERIEVSFTSDFRVEVEADVTYESITDTAEEYIKEMTKEVPQKGYGPSLLFLKDVTGGE
ncbi:pilus assembly protein TadG-related protein [Sporosarcina sp. Marseille-Q4943]|uniref:pilus assembly protein TadG-related protein n=1 Tax=Sporosarcina sp. Marseille-Q4943 TaxID=2942204 RepID=UPI00208DA3AC|nr:pilus assembly protein TadG-related protein [Sporosarcina sp. Marseille-Q4943]